MRDKNNRSVRSDLNERFFCVLVVFLAFFGFIVTDSIFREPSKEFLAARALT